MISKLRNKFRSLPIELKVTFPLLVFQVLLLVSLFLLADYLNSTQQSIYRYTERIKRVNSLTSSLSLMHDRIAVNLLSYRFNRNPANVEIVDRNELDMEAVVAELEKTISTDEERELFDQYLDASSGAEELRNSLIAAIDNRDADAIDASFNRWSSRSQIIEAALEDLTAYKIGTLERSAQFYDNFIVRVYVFLFMVTTASLAAVLLLFFYLQRVITKPVTQLSKNANKIAHGNFDVDFTLDRKDEVGNLAKSLSYMSETLKEYYEHLEKEVKVKQREIDKKEEIDRRKDEFISIASHELKTPLTSVKGYIQILENAIRKKDITKAEKYIKKANTYVDRLNRLVSDLLDISRIQGSKMRFNITSFPFADLLKSAVEIANSLTADHKIIVKNRFKGKISGDFDRLEQVFTNLISNAIKYSPYADKIVISAKKQKDMLLVCVEDFGIGIPKAKLNKIFTRFYRVESTAEKISGLGIGLFIASEIINRHGGKLWAESKLGKGSKFYFTIPAVSGKIPRE